MARAWENLSDPIFHFAQVQPAAPALQHEDDRLNYGELARLVGAASVHLKDLGVQPGTNVGVALGNTIDHVILSFALMRVGAVPVEVPLRAPPGRVGDPLARFVDKGFVFAGEGATVPPQSQRHAVAPGWRNTLPLAGDHRVVRDANAIHNFSMTSGSTGMPKGVLTTRAQWLARFEAAQRMFPEFLAEGRVGNFLMAGGMGFSALVAAGSRAGFIAALVGMAAMTALSGTLVARRQTLGWAALASAALLAIAWALFAINGSGLSNGLDVLVETGSDPIRLTLWNAAWRMIEGAPYLGLGLGTFENAYPLYAKDVWPYIMDKAHSDYLELAAGWGLPAAILWWSSILWLVGLCLRGIFIRRRNRQYAIFAVGASVLVGFHSAFDFPLQIPAIAFTFATILGLGVAQSFSTRSSG